ncbi:MAG: hypothetical protein KJS97_09985 [Alphaproteobacteria bacterium]|nr:hypothetical protein [Alphaproteobacteria bacterium]
MSDSAQSYGQGGDSDAWRSEEGRISALAVWGLYLLSIPSFAVFALVGVIVAYVQRDGSGALAGRHFDAQIRLFWIAFAWGVALFFASIAAWALTIVLIGFPLLWLIGVAGFIVMVWFTVKSVFGLVRLLDGRGP